MGRLVADHAPGDRRVLLDAIQIESGVNNLQEIRRLTYELDKIDYLLPSVSNLVEMVELSRDNPVLVSDGDKVVFLNAQMLELIGRLGSESSLLGRPLSDFVFLLHRFCPTLSGGIGAHSASAEEREFLVLIHRHRFNNEPFYVVIARGATIER